MKARAHAAVFVLSGLVLLASAPAGAGDVHLDAAAPRGFGYVGMYFGLIDPATDDDWYEAEVKDIFGDPVISTTWLAVVDTGASASILGKSTRDAYAIKTAIPMQTGVVFTDVGFGGPADFDVTEPVRMMLAGQKDVGIPMNAENHALYSAYGPIGGSVPPTITMAAAQDFIGGGSMDVDIIGTSILQGRILQVDPHQWEAMRVFTMAGALVQTPPPPPGGNVLYVPLRMQNFFNGSQNVDVGDNPMLTMKIRRTASDDFAVREALFDTGAYDNFVSRTFAEEAGIDLDNDWVFDTITIKGIGDDEITCPGYYVDALALELGKGREDDDLVIGNTSVFVIPDDEMPVTLDGSIRLDAILGNGVFADYMDLLTFSVEETDVEEWYVDMRDSDNAYLIVVLPEPASVTILLLGAIMVFRRRRK